MIIAPPTTLRLQNPLPYRISPPRNGRRERSRRRRGRPTAEETYIPSNPYKNFPLVPQFKSRRRGSRPPIDDQRQGGSRVKRLLRELEADPLGTLLGVLYLYFLFALPTLYFSRVGTIFEEAKLHRSEATELTAASQTVENPPEESQGATTRQQDVGLSPPSPTHTAISSHFDELEGSPALQHFQRSWEAFIDSLIKEWKTFNIVSALLLSCVEHLSNHILLLTLLLRQRSRWSIAN